MDIYKFLYKHGIFLTDGHYKVTETQMLAILQDYHSKMKLEEYNRKFPSEDTIRTRRIIDDE